MKHQSFIRSLFVAFCAFFVCVSAMAETVHLNPFAFKVSSRLKGDVFNVVYYLNAPATSVKVTITLPNEQTVVYNCTDSLNTSGTSRVKGIYKLKISLREYINNIPNFREKTDLPWSVDVMGGNEAAYPSKANGAELDAQEISTNYNFYNAGSIDIDINPYSENFGLIYVLERRKSTTTEDYFSTEDKTTKPGIYVFDPAFQNMPVTRGKYDFETGTNYTGAQLAYSFNATNYNAINGYYDLANLLMSARIAYDDDNETRLFVSCQTQSGPILMYGSAYYLNCTRGDMSSSWYHYVISGSRSTDYSLKSGSDFVAAPNIAFDIQGNKASRKAMMFSAAGENLVSGDDELNRENYRCDEYSLANYNYVLNTTSSPHNCKPTLTGVIDLYSKDDVLQKNSWYFNTWSPKLLPGKMIGFNVQLDLLGLEYDESGTGFWLCQTRDHHSGMPSLTHFKYNSSTGKYEVNFIEYWANRGRSAVRYDINHNRLAVSGGEYYIKESESSYSDSKFLPNTITKDGKTYYKHPAATPGYATIYTVDNSKLTTNFIGNKTKEQNEVGTTVTSRAIFSDSAYINLNGCKAADFSWDYADNLYVAMGADHKVTAFALPHKDKVVATPCKTDYYFNTPTQSVKIQITPNKSCGNVVDHDCPQMIQYWRNAEPNAFDYYYLTDDADGDNTDTTKVKFQLEARPAAGYRFYTWDNVMQDKALNSVTTVQNVSTYAKTNNDEKGRTAHFGIDVWETKSITQTNEEMTFKGVFVQRELDTKSYSTICLPFNLTTLEGTPYQGASVLKFDEAEDSDVAGDNRTFLTFKEVTFTNGDIMEAGVPYLIKLETAIAKGEEKIFKNVTCPPIGEQGETVTHNGVTFHGLLNPTTLQVKDKLFLTADNRLVTLYGQNSVNINGLRGYFTVSGSGAAQNVEFVLNLPEKVTTSIPMINLADSLKVTKYLWNGQIYIQRGNEVYDLSGARVK